MINGGFTTIEQMTDILVEENNLTGCMVGRMAMNNTWEVAKFDSVFYGDHSKTLTRREMMIDYAEFV